MQTETYTTETDRYARCVEISKRISWDIDADVIRGRKFDFGQKFLPDALSKVDELEFLTNDQKIYLLMNMSIYKQLSTNENQKSQEGGTGGDVSGETGGNTTDNTNANTKADSVDATTDAGQGAENAATTTNANTTDNTNDNTLKNDQTTEQTSDQTASAGGGIIKIIIIIIALIVVISVAKKLMSSESNSSDFTDYSSMQGGELLRLLSYI